MKPPICDVCGRNYLHVLGIETVQFADYQPLPPMAAGHPHGLSWLCPRHLDAATRLRHLPQAEAIAKIRQDLSVVPERDTEARYPEVWMLDAGRSPIQVAVRLRQYLSCTMDEARQVRDGVPTRVFEGALEGCNQVIEGLRAVGATCELRFYGDKLDG